VGYKASAPGPRAAHPCSEVVKRHWFIFFNILGFLGLNFFLSDNAIGVGQGYIENLLVVVYWQN